jgi:hypothetical protein
VRSAIVKKFTPVQSAAIQEADYRLQRSKVKVQSPESKVVRGPVNIPTCLTVVTVPVGLDWTRSRNRLEFSLQEDRIYSRNQDGSATLVMSPAPHSRSRSRSDNTMGWHNFHDGFSRIKEGT